MAECSSHESRVVFSSRLKRAVTPFTIMAWRFGDYKFVKKGYLNNRRNGITSGEIEFASIGSVRLELLGNMQEGLVGKNFRFTNPDYDPHYVFDHGGGHKSDASAYMEGFQLVQRGEVGDILNKPYLYIEWYSEGNGRCVLELDATNYEIVE